MTLETTNRTDKTGSYWLAEYRNKKGRLFLSEGSSQYDATLGLFDAIDLFKERQSKQIKGAAHG